MNFAEANQWLRYDRQIILPEVGLEGQKKLSKSKVLIVGAGGLGCPVLQYLTAAGIGIIGIADHDAVEISNLQRQVLYDETDEGKSKVEAAIGKLKKLNPQVKFVPYPFKINRSNVMEIISDYDVIVDGSDNFPTRYLIGDATAIQQKPLVFAAVHRFMGQLSVLNFRNGPTYRCLFPEQPEDAEVPTCSTAGVIGSLPGIMGNLQATEVIKIILETGNILSGKLLQFDLLSFNIDMIDVNRDEKNVVKSLGEYEEQTPCKVRRIDAKMLEQRLKNSYDTLIVDIRPANQFNACNVGGINTSPDEIYKNPDLLPTDKDIVLICEYGIKSRAIAESVLKGNASLKVFNLEGGMLAWKKYKAGAKA